MDDECLLVPVPVLPVVYWLPLGQWRWCKLGDVIQIVPGVAKLGKSDFHPTPEELINRFAALVRPNKISFSKDNPVRCFRYSLDGINLQGKNVPQEKDHRLNPPWKRFELDNPPITLESFVPEGWVRDVLRAIRKGVVAAYKNEDQLVGQTEERPDGHCHLVYLDPPKGENE